MASSLIGWSSGTLRLTRVPTPGRDSTSTSPPTSSARSRIPAIPSPRAAWSKVKPRPVVADRQLDPIAVARRARRTADVSAPECRAAFESASWATR